MTPAEPQRGSRGMPDVDFSSDLAATGSQVAFRDLLRIAAGAGQLFAVVRRVSDSIHAAVDGHKVIGRPFPCKAITEITKIRRSTSYLEYRNYLEEIGAGTLQLVAWSLLGQRQIEAACDKEVYQGIRKLDDYRRRKIDFEEVRVLAKGRRREKGTVGWLNQHKND
jgi:hypothetical protein